MLQDLSVSETELLRNLSKGHTYQEISEEMGISVGTVHAKLKALYKKISVRNRAEAAIEFLKKANDS